MAEFDFNQDIRVYSGGVEVFHQLRHLEDYDTVMKEGLKPRHIRVNEGKAEEVLFSEEYPWRDEAVFFQYFLNEQEFSQDEGWMSILVDPERTIIFNAALRDRNHFEYHNSRMSLGEYILFREEMNILQAKHPGRKFYLDPFTAIPREGFSFTRPPYDYNEILLPHSVKPPFHRSQPSK